MSGPAVSRSIGRGRSLQADLLVCGLGPRDRPELEEHVEQSIALVRSGAFTYASEGRSYSLSRGALLLCNKEESYCCSHEYCVGDECLVFSYRPELLDEVGAALGVRPDQRKRWFARPVLPPSARVEALVARAALEGAAFDEAGIALLFEVLAALSDSSGHRSASRKDRDRARAAVELIEARLDSALALDDLAAEVELSPFHFLRLFRRETGLTPHQYLIAARLRRAIELLSTTRQAITEIALEVGFEDLSNFVRTFKKRVGVTPRDFRRGDRRLFEARRKILQVDLGGAV